MRIIFSLKIVNFAKLSPIFLWDDKSRARNAEIFYMKSQPNPIFPLDNQQFSPNRPPNFHQMIKAARAARKCFQYVIHFLMNRPPTVQRKMFFSLCKTAIFINNAPILIFGQRFLQNAFYLRKATILIKIALIIKWLKKSNAKRILPRENSHFHQDRPHRKVSKKVQRKTRFT